MSLEEKFPLIAQQWNYAKNGDLKPSDVTYGSDKRVWWICKKAKCGCIHEWETSISKRTSDLSDCPYCAGRKLDYHNSLEYKYPLVALNWDYEKNGDIKPSNITCCSGTIVHWICKDAKCGCIHKFEMSIANKVQSNSCSYCSSSGSKIDVHDTFKHNFPFVYKEWDFEKNIDINPDNLRCSSSVCAHWKCHKGHSWNTQIYNRTKGKTGCPQCEQSGGERIIDNILTEFKFKFIYNKRFDDCKDKNTLPFDFYIEEENFLVEYDGRQHTDIIDYFDGEEGFNERVKHDNIKNKYAKDNNFKLLRIPYTFNEKQIRHILEAIVNCYSLDKLGDIPYRYETWSGIYENYPDLPAHKKILLYDD